ncbi:hypothetical protein [Lacticaseibacillus paracasei]|uniref:hypothetical protein n=1 Tax=Lacticaseibacillus paracasei TaxID=1597 RepID=UPI000D70578B|nr:hypothetical protein [Lacticaseibacillus paracasei]AWN84203.1 hypothetical protein LPEG9_09500 [Lacticaseibacillus paracasei]AWN84614.1 hypothetical protein LPEG9_11845 [Lacticaseibacillus paracasei]
MTRKIDVFTLYSITDVDTVNQFLKMHPQAKLNYVTPGSEQCSYDALVIADYEDDEEDDEVEVKQ